MEMDLPESFQNGMKNVLAAYIKMKDAFVESNASVVAREAKVVLDLAKNLDMTGLGTMERGHLDDSIKLLQSISKKEELDSQRTHFVELNEHMVPLASCIKPLDQTLYVQQCPMANNNRGAVWLSSEKEIRNPYYGDEMLSCGKVEKILN